MVNDKILFALAGAGSGVLWSLLGWARKNDVAFNWKLFSKELVASVVLGFFAGLVADSWEIAVMGASVGEEALKLVPQYNTLGKK